MFEFNLYFIKREIQEIENIRRELIEKNLNLNKEKKKKEKIIFQHYNNNILELNNKLKTNFDEFINNKKELMKFSKEHNTLICDSSSLLDKFYVYSNFYHNIIKSQETLRYYQKFNSFFKIFEDCKSNSDGKKQFLNHILSYNESIIYLINNYFNKK